MIAEEWGFKADTEAAKNRWPDRKKEDNMRIVTNSSTEHCSICGEVKELCRNIERAGSTEDETVRVCQNCAEEIGKAAGMVKDKEK